MIAMSKFENINDINADMLAVIENLTAEFEQRLLAVMHPDGSGYPNRAAPYGVPMDGAPPVNGRTEALINRGRPGYRRPRRRRLLAHWRLITAGVVALLTGVVAALVATRGSGAAWPASVATVASFTWLQLLQAGTRFNGRTENCG